MVEKILNCTVRTSCGCRRFCGAMAAWCKREWRGENAIKITRRRLEAELGADETLLWSGQPSLRGYLAENYHILILAVPWMIMSLCWLAGAEFDWDDLSSVRSILAMLAFPALLIGLVLMYFPVNAYLKGRFTVYAVTDKRALIGQGVMRFSLTSYASGKLRNIKFEQKKGNFGSAVFAELPPKYPDGPFRQTGFIKIYHIKEATDALNVLLAGR